MVKTSCIKFFLRTFASVLFKISDEMTNSNNHLVLMAGGVGSRFWPMSTPEQPKQFIDIMGVGRTLLQLTYDRFRGLVPDENVWVLTNKDYADIVFEQLPEINRSHVLLEPNRRNTAPCIAYVSWRIKSQDANANIVVTPSDAVVMDVAEFRRVIASGLKFASETDAIVTLGMKPTRPETGYGYIMAELSNPSMRNKELFRVDSFREKPDLALAKEYVRQNNYFWNAGIFIWNVSTIVNAFRVYQPVMARIFEQLMPYYGTEREQERIDAVYGDCESISIDYAIMEKADETFVFPASFGWSDLGTWGSLLSQTKQDTYGNSLIGDNIKVYDTHGCVVHVAQAKKVVIQGLDDYIVAERDGMLLICRLSEEQRIKQFSTD